MVGSLIIPPGLWLDLLSAYDVVDKILVGSKIGCRQMVVLLLLLITCDYMLFIAEYLYSSVTLSFFLFSLAQQDTYTLPIGKNTYFRYESSWQHKIGAVKESFEFFNVAFESNLKSS